MGTINQSYMQRPDAIRMARGQAVSMRPGANLGEIYGPGGEVVGHSTNGGIRNPRETEIPAGSTVMRFGVAPSVGNVAAGSWWLDFANYKKLESYADSHGASVGAAARMLCAVPVEWSSMTLLVQARTLQPLSAFIGEGNPAFATNAVNVQSIVNPRLYSKDPVEQLFIPGLSNPDLRKQAILVRGYRMIPGAEAGIGYAPELQIAR